MQSRKEWVSSAGDPLHPLNGNQCSSEMLVKTVRQHGSYTSPRHPKPRRSEGRRKTAACGRTSGCRRAWPDLAAAGRVKIYGCSYRWDADNTGDMCWLFVSLAVSIKPRCRKKQFPTTGGQISLIGLEKLLTIIFSPSGWNWAEDGETTENEWKCADETCWNVLFPE